MNPVDTNPFNSIDFNSPTPNTVLGSRYLNPDYLFGKMYAVTVKVFNYFAGPDGIHAVKTLMFLLAVFFITIIIYSLVRVMEIRHKEHKHLHHELAEYAHHQAEKEKKAREANAGSINPRWGVVLQYLFSPSENDWRLAIIEADAMLEDLLNTLGFEGESIGDKLKAAREDNFKGLPAAWEAHTVRNRIAHEGSAFHISSPEAKRIIALYEQIFRGYGYI